MNYDNVDVNLFYYPTTVALVDDNESFLTNMRLQLSSAWATVLFTNPNEALSVVCRNELNAAEFQHEFITISDGQIEQNNKRTLDVNISNSYKKIYDHNRFSEICVVIVDYDIPGNMNGLDFCEKITQNENSFVRVIMLTGKADNSIAVSAFNDGRIHKFLVKSVNDSREELLSVLKAETNKSFYHRSELLRQNFLLKAHSQITKMGYKKIFNMVLENSAAIEYYLLDYSGSFIFLDKNARPTFLLVKSAEDLNNQYRIAKDAEAGMDIISKLEHKTHLLQLLNDEDYNLSPSEWGPYLYPAIKAEGEDFYYAIVSKEIEGISLNGVVSFNSYLKDLS